MRKDTLTTVMPVMLLATAAAVAAEQEPLPRVDARVYEELQQSADGTAYVIVLLRQEVAPDATPANVRIGIRGLQDRVLSSLAPDEFNVAYQYRNLAALTGRVSAAGLEKLADDVNVLRVGPDQKGHAHLNHSVPFIGAGAAHTLGVTGEGVTVAVLDTGIDTDHPDLSDDIAAGAWHFLNQGGNTGSGAEDDNGHGTNVAGIITSKGQVASVGVAPDADILAVKVLNSGGTGWVSDWIAGVDYVVDWKGDHPGANLAVINMSLGTNDRYVQCPCDNAGLYTQLLQAALAAAKGVGIVTFASSGNVSTCQSMSSPACLSAAVAVAAVYDQDLGTYESPFFCTDTSTFPDKVTCFSSRSACNELAAPGVLITAPRMGGGTSTFTGTSQAAPHVAGTAALMHEVASKDWFSPDSLAVLLKATGWLTFDWDCTQGPKLIRVDALAAVEAVEDGLPCPCRADLVGAPLTCPPDGNVDSWDVSVVEECVGGGFSGCNVPCDVDCNGLLDAGDVEAATCLAGGVPAEMCCWPGDLDDDGDVELTDYQIFHSCMDGPSSGVPMDCDQADLQRDSDVDLEDLAGFLIAFGAR